MIVLKTVSVACVVAAAAALRLAVAHASAPVPPGASAPPVVSKGEALRADIDALDATIQAGLEELARSTADFAAERDKWQSLDRSMESARSVNAALLARNKAVVNLFGAKLEGPLEQFRQRLIEAPRTYRELADERRRLLAAATLDVERTNYMAMIETCEAAALLCERRSEELFGEAPAGDGFGNRSRRANATSLRRTIENMKKLQTMHEKWEETFAAYPTVLEAPALSNWFTALSLYSEDLDSFSKNVNGLKDAMKQKATPPAPKAGEDGAKPAAPVPETAVRGQIGGIVPVAGPGNRVTYYQQK